MAVTLLIPGFDYLPFEGKPGRKYDRLEPKKLLLHSTEGSSIEGALGAYAKYPPHVIVDYRTKQRIQHVPLDLASYSLRGSESDDEPCIQVEIVGFSFEAPSWTVGMLDWLCEEVFQPIRLLWPFPLKAPPQGFVSAQEAKRDRITLVSVNSPIRFTKSSFEKFGGICAHQHVPPPDTHWDVPINIAYVLQKMKSLDLEPVVNESYVAVFKELAKISHPLVVVEAIYQALLLRPAGGTGLAYWSNLLNQGTDVIEMIDYITASPEYKSKHI